MAKLHSELRIKAVTNIIGGSEGDPVNFAEGDIVYDLTSDKFKVLDNLGAWQDAVTGVSADLSATSVSALQDIDFNGVTLDGAGGEGKILAWSQAGQAFVPVDPAAGAGDAISLGDTAVTITDTGADGNIELKTDNVVRWNIGPQGHLIPAVNNQFDIGSPELKVRDMYISSASLWIGDEHKVAISDGKMKFLKRRKDKVPSGVPVDIAAIRGIPGIPADVTTDQMSLSDWKIVADNQGIPFEQVYNKDNDLDWEQDDSLVDSTFFGSGSSAVLKKFNVAVDNKVPSVWKGDPAQQGGNAFYIDGIPHPELRLKAGTYRFFQRHISNAFDNAGAALGGGAHPLRFYTQEDKSGLLETANPTKVIYWDGDSSVGGFADYEAVFIGLGNDQAARDGFQGMGLYVELVVDETLPAEFWYGCDNHGYMGMKIINEAAAAGGGASVADDLGDISTGGAVDGDALIKVGDSFVPRKVAVGEVVSVTHTADANPNVFALHADLAGGLGGRIILDLDNNANTLSIELDLEELEASTPKTMNFEIFSVGTRPFDVRVKNNDGLGDRTLKSVVSPSLSLDGLIDDQQTISVGEGQMMIVYCDGISWYYEIRSGL